MIIAKTTRMVYGKTEKLHPPVTQYARKGTREEFYEFKRYVREMRAIKIIAEWLKSKKSKPLDVHYLRFYKWLDKCAEKGGLYAD